MSHTLTVPIDKLRMWCAGEWKIYDMNNTQINNTFIKIHYDQLFILSGNKLLESLNINGKMKGIYKDDVLILIICNSLQQVRKIKFQIKTNVKEFIYKLGLHFPVVNFNNSSISQRQTKYRNVEDVLKKAIKEKVVAPGPPLPSNFEEFLKMCLLDPVFPHVVNEVQDILKKLDI